jgi:hypothetical protein
MFDANDQAIHWAVHQVVGEAGVMGKRLPQTTTVTESACAPSGTTQTTITSDVTALRRIFLMAITSR